MIKFLVGLIIAFGVEIIVLKYILNSHQLAGIIVIPYIIYCLISIFDAEEVKDNE